MNILLNSYYIDLIILVVYLAAVLFAGLHFAKK